MRIKVNNEHVKGSIEYENLVNDMMIDVNNLPGEKIVM